MLKEKHIPPRVLWRQVVSALKMGSKRKQSGPEGQVLRSQKNQLPIPFVQFCLNKIICPSKLQKLSLGYVKCHFYATRCHFFTCVFHPYNVYTEEFSSKFLWFLINKALVYNASIGYSHLYSGFNIRHLAI